MVIYFESYFGKGMLTGPDCPESVLVEKTLQFFDKCNTNAIPTDNYISEFCSILGLTPTDDTCEHIDYVVDADTFIIYEPGKHEKNTRIIYRPDGRSI